MTALEELGLTKDVFRELSADPKILNPANTNHPIGNSFKDFMQTGSQLLKSENHDLILKIINEE